ncbi:MAG: cytochrome C [Lysobacterales bacterium CG_4_10_14_3_um_filter_64_11]|nr:MAG: cytochrome C [Xanthomonadales bacterium CG_4_10_14_3_um_filter_64_11]
MKGHAMTLRLIIALTLGSVAFGAHANGSIDAGKQKSQTCQACHGADGNGIGITMYPILAGQHADYLRKALGDYKSGARVNPIMAGFAGALSEQDIADLAAYFSSQQGPLVELNADPAK